MTQCIWGLLSKEELEFIHVSDFYKLKGQSLFKYIHPEEVSLAKRDLYEFIRANKFGGSITRCRMKDYTINDNYHILTTKWVIVDIIMYSVTKDLVLIFLHQKDNNCINSCRIKDKDYSLFNIKQNILDNSSISPSMSTSSSFSSSPTLEYEYNESYQSFHIFNHQSKSIELNWPDYTKLNYDSSLFHKSFASYPSCFHSVQLPSKFNPYSGQKIQTLKIDYGNITFIIIHKEKSYQNMNFYKLKQSRKYQPYFNHCCQNCGTDSSPEWRRGPTGHKTLCNACGLRYSRSVARQERIANQQKQISFESQGIQQKIQLHYHSSSTIPSYF